jgi:hypothetical protein
MNVFAENLYNLKMLDPKLLSRKKRGVLKREIIINEILDILYEVWISTESYEEAINTAESYIQQKLQEFPQEKSLYEEIGSRIEDVLKESIIEYAQRLKEKLERKKDAK